MNIRGKQIERIERKRRSMKNAKRFLAFLMAAFVLCFTVATDAGSMLQVCAEETENGTITNISDVKAAATGTFTVKGTVTFVDGANVYVEDETGGIDLYFTGTPSSINVGNIVTATGTKTTYNGLIELKNVAEDKCIVEAGDETLPFTTTTIADVLADYTSGAKVLQSRRVKIENATIGEVNTSGNTTLTQGDATINIYKCPALSEISAGDTVTLYATVGAYNGAQLRVVKDSDVTKVAGGALSGETESSVDSSIVVDYAQWINGKDLEGATAYTSQAGADETASLSVYLNGERKAPIITTSGGTGTNYYIGFSGLGSAENSGYFEFALNPAGKFGAYGISMSLKGSGTAAKDWTLSYSTDGATFVNVTTFTIATKSTYYDFTATLPAEANASEKLYLRLTPGSTSISNGTIGSGGNLYLSGVAITASPVLSDAICAPVIFSLAAGEVVAGQELELSCATEGASIYYSINDSNYEVYSAATKPVLSAEVLKDGATVKAYASLSGKTDSITTSAAYTQVQCAPVKATPNGGAVAKNTQVTLSCETEGATIQYSSDNGANWTNSTGKLTLTKLPATYLVKAVKAGCKDSSTTTLSYTERQNSTYNLYFGQLHSHTSYSDGAGTIDEAYKHAQEVENIDFLAVTDHSNSFDNADKASIADGSVSTEWVEGQQKAQEYTTDDFVGIFGYEMTWSNGLGHMNTFNTDGFQSRTQTAYSTYSTALQNYYATLKTDTDSISQFNHPGTTFGDFSDFAYYDEEIDNLITTVEVGNGEGAIGSSGYFPSYEYYQRALDKGWHVAPTNNQDNHKGLWGDANTGRSVVMADSLTRENIYDAMRNYRVYATEDNDLNIYYTLDGYEMGTILEEGMTGESVALKVKLSDATDSSIGTVSVITNGGLVLATETLSASSGIVDFTIDNDYSYYYIKVVEADGDIAVTAPVWVGEVEAAGINSISTDEVLPVEGEALPVDLELYNNENVTMDINSIQFLVDDQVVHTVDLAAAGLTKVESMGTANYSFDFTYDKVGSMQLNVVVNATMNGAEKIYKSVLKLTYVSPEMVTKVVIDGTHYNDYVTGYYGGNVGNFTAIAGNKSIKVEVVKDEITAETLEDCALLIISAPAKKSGTANAGAYTSAHFSDEFIQLVKDYTDKGGALIACGIADYQDSTSGQTATEMNKLLSAIGATTTLNSDEAYDEVNNGGQPYRLYLTNCNTESKYLAGAVEGQEYSAYSGCTVKLNADAVAEGKAEALVTGFDTTYSIDCKDEEGNKVSGSPTYVEKGNVVALAHETLESGANIFVAGTVFISDFEVEAELDNIWDVPYLNRTIVENILDEVKVELPRTTIADVRNNGEMGDVFAIEGYVTAGTSVEGNTFFDTIYVQDETGGITVFPYSESGLEIGTKIRITGYVDAYQGDKELQVIESKILSEEEPYIFTPEKMSAADAMNYSKSGGKLVQVEGKVVDALYDSEGTGVSQLWLDDGSGTVADVFIDGYILSGTTGKNELASFVKVGNTVSAVGLVYAHPEGESDEAVTCLRVRNCDEIKLVSEAADNIGDSDNTGDSDNAGDSGNIGDSDNTGDSGNTGDSDTTGKSENMSLTGTVSVTTTADWSNVTTAIGVLPTGGTLSVNLIGTNVVNGSVFDTLKGQDKNIVFNMSNGVRWTINGKSITGSGFGEIDLGVVINTTAIPQNLVNHVAADGNGYLEFSLNYDGEFGFEATLTMYAGKEYAGQYANLFYYNETTGKMELMGSYLIDESGYANMVFTHASDYVIVMDEVAYITSAKTGDTTDVAGYILLLAIGCMVMIQAKKKRYF